VPPHADQLKLDNQLCFALYDASRAFTRAYAPLLAEIGLTYPQYLVMLVLWEAEDALSVGALGGRLHLDSGTLTPLLKRLAGQGLVARTRDPGDERRVLISLTPAGDELRARAAAIPGQIYQRCGVPPETAPALMGELSRIVRALGQADEPLPSAGDLTLR
jgi:DNA-binding MarR family transcriptional regulator